MLMRVTPCGNKNRPHDKGAEDAPEQHFILIRGGNAKIVENQQEDKKIVNAQGALYQIAGQKLQRDVGPPPEVNHRIEKQRHDNPDSAPDTVIPSA